MLACHHCWRRSVRASTSAYNVTFRRSYAFAPLPFSPDRRPQVSFRDPHKLADAVKRQLLKGESIKALQLTQEASKSMDSVVSWNHLIRHHIERGNIRSAFKTYNDMKKRDVFPDSYTFSILLNGLAGDVKQPVAHEKALELYNSMTNPNSPVQPQVIHTNAVLKVCARCGDVDSMWSIVSRLPLSGPNAPDAITYTTLLNGIHGAQEVDDGRRVWAGILSRWGNGKLWVDEDLACAMGRVLLSGDREEHWREVLTVVEQVFGIKDRIAERGEVKRPADDLIFIEGSTKPVSEIHRLLGHNPAPSSPSVDESNSVVPYVPPTLRPPSTSVERSSGSNSSATRPLPGNNTLTLLLQACTLLDDLALAKHYWKILTSAPYHIRPDIENYHDILRLLRRSRLGPEALEVLESMISRPETSPTAKTFFIAMSCCKRSGRGRSFATAEKMLSLMTELHIRIDVKILTMFLQCGIKTDDLITVKRALRIAEEKFDMPFELEKLYAARAREDLIETHLELVKWMHGIIDRLLEDSQITWGHGERAVFEAKRGKLVKMVTKFGWIAGGGKGGGKWARSGARGGDVEAR